MSKVKTQGVVYIVLSIALVLLGFVISGPAVDNFMIWLLMPGMMFLTGAVLIWRSRKHCQHDWIAVRRSQSHDINLNIDRCRLCGKEHHTLG